MVRGVKLVAWAVATVGALAGGTARADLLVSLGSENSNNCRYAACVVPTLPSAKK